ncbi:MAG: sigma-54-dependent transcriptional regulator [Filomicrobium sp.]
MTPKPKHLLLIEDDVTLRRLILKRLERADYAVTGVESWSEAKTALANLQPSLILLDVRLPDANGLEKLPKLKEIAPVVVITAFGSINDAVRAIRSGAIDYLIKPINPDTLEAVIERALETSSIRRSYEFLRDEARRKTPTLIGSSPGLREVRKQIELLAPSQATVLILGESGVGKELVARAVHDASPRSAANFTAVDCATLQDTLFESELFGHERGAFTGADQKKEGLVEVSEGGTVFLDEIGDLPLSQQVKLLRVIETGRFRRVGGTRNIACDVRFVAATNRDLLAMSQDGSFRRDLYYRLSALVLDVPPLRDRRDDIVEIAELFIVTRSFDRQIDKVLTPEAAAVLQTYDWPGNARELRNVIERALLASRNEQDIKVEHLGLPQTVTDRAVASNPKSRVELRFTNEPTLDEVRNAYLRIVAERRKGNRSDIARTLGISERSVYRILKEIE